MTVQLISQPQYKIDRFPNLTYTESSESDLNRVQAVQFAKDRNAVLQSMPEAAAFRIEADKQFDADLYQVTRSAALYLIDHGKAYVGFDHDPEKSFILTKTQEGYDANKAGKEYVLPKKNKTVKDALKRVKLSELPESNLELRLNGEFAENPVVQGLLGEIAQPYESFLKSKGKNTGYVYLLTPNTILKETQNEGVLIRPCGLGGVVFNYLVASNNFNYDSRARGVTVGQKNKRKSP